MAKLIAHKAPDILVLSGLDHDHALVALHAFRDLIAEQGHDFRYLYAKPPNSGLLTGLAPAEPSRPTHPDDPHGYGHFRGAGGLALLSRVTIVDADAQDFATFLWQDLPDAQLPQMTAQRQPVQRLSSTGHWNVPLDLDTGARLHLLIYQAGPPVFGPAGGWNRARNHDETAFWLAYLDHRLPMPPPEAPVVVIGGSNLDPFDGDGQHDAMRALITHPRLQDPQPESRGAVEAAWTARDQAHLGPAAQDTVHWPQDPGPGNLRVSYILPDASLTVIRSGVFWPGSDSPDATLLGDPDDPPTRHRLVWVDLDVSGLGVPNDQLEESRP